MTITFTIQGNQENPIGNPLGYHRTTQRGKYGKANVRYYKWLMHVRSAFIKANAQKGNEMIPLSKKDKPIESGSSKVYLHTKIYFHNNSRSDPDNVQKGIADALFVNDKNVAGSYDFELAEDKAGKVLVTIIIQD